jgi:predicted signal transduction protein with EAL and GGDEF domain
MKDEANKERGSWLLRWSTSIRHVGKRLANSAGSSNMVARLGGDEFAIVIEEALDEHGIGGLCQMIVEACAAPYQLTGAPIHASVSVGVAPLTGQSLSGLELLRRADIALYEAKKRGRGRYELYANALNDVVIKRQTIEADLRHALETGTELRAAYQPLFASDGKHMIGAEALVRWDHPVHGPLSPDHFIGIAEERGLINALGDFMLRQACNTLSGTSIPWIAVNLSPIQLKDEGLVERILDIIHQAGIDASRLQLEITEGVLLQNAEGSQRSLQALRSRGIRIALDDFGTGYSSMSYLKDYNVDKLKIDRSFVSKVGASDGDAIVMAMISLAQALNLKVTAEGVENEFQRVALARMGCQELQGYLMSHPISQEELMVRYGQAGSQEFLEIAL